MDMTNIALGSSVSTAASVANEFLSLGEREGGKVPPIDQMKLQKLLFYAHAWHLAHNEKPLFDEDFEAWPWGSVVADIYSQTRKFGRSAVTGRILEFSPDNGFVAPSGVCDDLKSFIEEVWNVHKNFTGIQLSNATHAHGEPWTIIKEHYGSLEDKPNIPNTLIASVYKNKLRNEQNNTSTQ